MSIPSGPDPQTADGPCRRAGCPNRQFIDAGPLCEPCHDHLFTPPL